MRPSTPSGRTVTSATFKRGPISREGAHLEQQLLPLFLSVLLLEGQQAGELGATARGVCLVVIRREQQGRQLPLL